MEWKVGIFDVNKAKAWEEVVEALTSNDAVISRPSGECVANIAASSTARRQLVAAGGLAALATALRLKDPPSRKWALLSTERLATKGAPSKDDPEGDGFLEEILDEPKLIPALMALLGAATKEDAEIGADGTVALESQLESILADAFEAELIHDAVIARSAAQRLNFWAMREGTLEAMQRHGPWVMNDISFQVSDLPGVIADMEAAFTAVAPGPFCVAFGHMGDGNLHINARPYDKDPMEHPEEAQAIKNAVRDIVIKWRGSISAEHGIGLDKQQDMKDMKDPVAYAMMKSIKQALDPDNLLNPGKVLI